MSKHSRRGPSKAHRFLNCPGTFAMAESLPPNLQKGHSDAARLGTATHALVEHCLKKSLDPAEMRDRIIIVMEDGEDSGTSILKPKAKLPKPEPGRWPFIVNDEMIMAACVCTDYVRARCRDLFIDEAELELESRTNPIPGRDDTPGTADVTIPAKPEVLEVVDFKNGRQMVEHVDNDQVRAYLLGKAIDYKWEFNIYRATIVQPNAIHPAGYARSVEYTERELKGFQSTYLLGIRKCESAESEYKDIKTAGPNEDQAAAEWADKWLKAGDHCEFCEAGAACPARRRMAEQAAAIEFANEPLNLPIVPEGGPLTRNAAEQVSHILKWKPFLESLFGAAEFYALKSMESGNAIPGFKLVHKMTKRKWIDKPEAEIAKAIIKEGYVAPDDDIWKKELRTGPQVEKLVSSKRRKEFSAKFLFKPEGDLTVAPENDSRPRAARNIVEDFRDEEEPDFG